MRLDRDAHALAASSHLRARSAALPARPPLFAPQSQPCAPRLALLHLTTRHQPRRASERHHARASSSAARFAFSGAPRPAQPRPPFALFFVSPPPPPPRAARESLSFARSPPSDRPQLGDAALARAPLAKRALPWRPFPSSPLLRRARPPPPRPPSPPPPSSCAHARRGISFAAASLPLPSPPPYASPLPLELSLCSSCSAERAKCADAARGRATPSAIADEDRRRRRTGSSSRRTSPPWHLHVGGAPAPRPPDSGAIASAPRRARRAPAVKSARTRAPVAGTEESLTVRRRAVAPPRRSGVASSATRSRRARRPAGARRSARSACRRTRRAPYGPAEQSTLLREQPSPSRPTRLGRPRDAAPPAVSAASPPRSSRSRSHSACRARRSRRASAIVGPRCAFGTSPPARGLPTPGRLDLLARRREVGEHVAGAALRDGLSTYASASSRAAPSTPPCP